ncbi:TPA: CopG family transcriptional regulator [Burkholderia aenigmatica]|uniref:ribbon-helix-helix protein, CopG family n=1 Tax=Burkholderia sp. AU45251 TaxID=3059204 RepID=UPI00264FAA86|nr:ribbon-helix-helix protein, CopG family [Burkholderia sp. AU45251]HDR9481826.1 CopG family transcriptional regulator [Burkholderia aenigmatica]MDN7513548.1 ribbon-helix-helix protein, CopG family [Burkholderia sp. AU45251]HDR9513353.1 CopG family transcriptional regulator [Burkholderia aenigmatica]HDR9590197.1 CopG family transcriptional regulator [Burkholderia aenigmatica]HDR9601804.1 CopG family transcriptional regulator [Burkholderia aenigmatica]
MSRILVDLSDGQLDELAAIVETEHRPRAAIIRDAIDAYIALHKQRPLADDVFGLWKDHTIDGLAYQEKLRSEW